MTDIWQAALSDLETKVSAHNFESWFRNIQFHHQDGYTAHLEVADEFFKAWIEENYLDLIVESLRAVSGIKMSVIIGVKGAFGEAQELPRSLDVTPRQAAVAPRSSRMMQQPMHSFGSPQGLAPARTPQLQTNFFEALTPQAPDQPISDQDLQRRILEAGLNPRYNFDEFVVGPSNQFTHAACVSIAKNPGHNYNPLFIFGGVGLGKTHLLQAVGIEILKRNPNMRVLNLSSEEFMNQLITSLRQKDMNSFRAQFRNNCDVLLIDDIQFIGGKDSTQEEFFHTFNALYHSGKHIVMTSDKSPKELPGLEERLRSRFSWGLIADIQPPDLETRIAILERKAEVDGISLDKDVAILLAGAISSNVRELEGTLVRLGAEASFMRSRITVEMAREHLRRMNIEQPQQLSVDRIICAVAEHFDITAEDIKGARRTRAISEPRQYAMFLARKHTDHSYPELGKRFGGKDHTTVLAAVRKLEDLIQTDQGLQRLIAALEERIHA